MRARSLHLEAPHGSFEVQGISDEARRVVEALPADVAGRTRTVEVGSVDEITLVLASGRRVVWGSAEQSGTKAEVLAVMLPQLPRDVDEIDVSVPGRLTTR